MIVNATGAVFYFSSIMSTAPSFILVLASWQEWATLQELFNILYTDLQIILNYFYQTKTCKI
jgi:hypothetical protein